MVLNFFSVLLWSDCALEARDEWRRIVTQRGASAGYSLQTEIECTHARIGSAVDLRLRHYRSLTRRTAVRLPQPSSPYTSSELCLPTARDCTAVPLIVRTPD